ncbi:MAG: hypothetical protein GDA44_09755 [Prochloron sp. SP5CPC1]|nr:hypothetical protein [Candidatus Paraprochloron terpiosi SP5CPC1]
MNTQLKDIWLEIIIEDDSSLSGKFVASFMKEVTIFLSLKFVVLDYLSGSNIAKINSYHISRIELLEPLIQEISKVGQFEWCDFFFFRKGGFIPSENEQYDKIIPCTDLTVRAVDQSYLYVYTINQRLLELIKSKYDAVTVNQDKLCNFIFPE